VALADASADRRAAVAAALGGDAPTGYDDWNEMLGADELDAVVVAVPHHLHERALVDAAHAGVNMLSEKPLAATLEEVDRIADAIAEAGVRLAIMHNWRYNDDVAAAIDAIVAGRIGTPFLVRNESLWGGAWAGKDPRAPDWRLKGGGGVVIDVAYHSLYVAEAELMSPIRRVFASIGTFAAAEGSEDTATLVLTHENGGTTCIQRSWAVDAGGNGAHEVHGTGGSIRFRQLDPRAMSLVFRGDYAGLAKLPKPADQRPPVEIFEKSAGEWQPLFEPTEPIPWWQGMRTIFAQTFDAWAQGEEAPTGLEAARHALTLVTAAYLSAERREAVDVAELERETRGLELRPAARESH
jgi:predicted dehydrogenase